MTRRILTLAVLLTVVLAISVQAMEPRVISAKPRLSFNGTTAICSATCTGNGTNDVVEATMTLYRGSIYVDSWSDMGTGRLYLYGEHAAISGKEYKLVLEYSINGEEKPSVYVIKICP